MNRAHGGLLEGKDKKNRERKEEKEDERGNAELLIVSEGGGEQRGGGRVRAEDVREDDAKIDLMEMDGEGTEEVDYNEDE